jgi:putative NADH-flavin reductase
MKLLILGPSGGVGRLLVPRTLESGHLVTVLARSPSYVAPAGVRVVRGEVLEGGALDEAMEGQDAVLCTIGQQRRHPANPWSRSVSPPDLNAAAARRIVASMRACGVRRIVAVSAAGVGDSAPGLNAAMRFFLATTMIGTAYRDLAAMERLLAESGLDWLCPRPTRLTDGPRTGQVRIARAFGAFDDISRADVAEWMLDALRVPVWPDPTWGGRTPQITRG